MIKKTIILLFLLLISSKLFALAPQGFGSKPREPYITYVVFDLTYDHGKISPLEMGPGLTSGLPEYAEFGDIARREVLKFVLDRLPDNVTIDVLPAEIGEEYESQIPKILEELAKKPDYQQRQIRFLENFEVYFEGLPDEDSRGDIEHCLVTHNKHVIPYLSEKSELMTLSYTGLEEEFAYINNKALTNQLFGNLAPAWQILGNQDWQHKAQSFLDKYSEDQNFVLKPIGGSNGKGVIVVKREDLVAHISLLFESSQESLELEKKVLKNPKAFEYWLKSAGDKDKIVMLQRFVPSQSIEVDHEDVRYPTMRAVCALYFDGQDFHSETVYTFWKLGNPQNSTEDLSALYVSDIHQSAKNIEDVEVAIHQKVASSLNELLPRIYRQIHAGTLLATMKSVFKNAKSSAETDFLIYAQIVISRSLPLEQDYEALRVIPRNQNFSSFWLAWIIEGANNNYVIEGRMQIYKDLLAIGDKKVSAAIIRAAKGYISKGINFMTLEELMEIIQKNSPDLFSKQELFELLMPSLIEELEGFYIPLRVPLIEKYIGQEFLLDWIDKNGDHSKDDLVKIYKVLLQMKNEQITEKIILKMALSNESPDDRSFLDLVEYLKGILPEEELRDLLIPLLTKCYLEGKSLSFDQVKREVLNLPEAMVDDFFKEILGNSEVKDNPEVLEVINTINGILISERSA